jgi:hypothetical protein
MEIFVDVTPEIHPSFHRGVNPTFEMYVPGVKVKLAISCNPPPKQYPDLVGFRPCEEFHVVLPEVQRVIFDPRTNTPPNGRLWCQTHKCGAVLELPPHVTMNSRIQTHSPFGSRVVEDPGGGAVLNFRLQVDGEMAVCQNCGNMGANRLEVDLRFVFDCYMGGPPVANPSETSSLLPMDAKFASNGWNVQGQPASNMGRSIGAWLWQPSWP